MGVLLSRSVVVLAILEELVRVLSSSSQSFEYLLGLCHVDSHVSVLLVGGISVDAGCFKQIVED